MDANLDGHEIKKDGSIHKKRKEKRERVHISAHLNWNPNSVPEFNTGSNLSWHIFIVYWSRGAFKF